MAKRVDLIKRRVAAGYSQVGLAERLGVDRATVQRWESGERTPQPRTRPGLAQALGITANELATLLAAPDAQQRPPARRVEEQPSPPVRWLQ